MKMRGKVPSSPFFSHNMTRFSLSWWVKKMILCLPSFPLPPLLSSSTSSPPFFFFLFKRVASGHIRIQKHDMKKRERKKEESNKIKVSSSFKIRFCPFRLVLCCMKCRRRTLTLNITRMRKKKQERELKIRWCRWKGSGWVSLYSHITSFLKLVQYWTPKIDGQERKSGGRAVREEKRKEIGRESTRIKERVSSFQIAEQTVI